MITDGHLGTLSSGETVGHSNFYVCLNDLRSLQTAESRGSQDMFFQELVDKDQVMVKGNALTLVLISSHFLVQPMSYFGFVTFTHVCGHSTHKNLSHQTVLSLVNNDLKKSLTLQDCKGGKDVMKSDKTSSLTRIWPPPLRLRGVSSL